MAAQKQVLSAPVKIVGAIWVRGRFEPVTVAEATPNFLNYLHSMLRSTQTKIVLSFSYNGTTFIPVGAGFTSSQGRWVGTKIGVFAQAGSCTPSNVATRVGYAKLEAFTVSAE